MTQLGRWYVFRDLTDGATGITVDPWENDVVLAACTSYEAARAAYRLLIGQERYDT